MDKFKKMSSTTAMSWDWDVPRVCKRAKGDTQKLHKISRAKLKKDLEKQIKEIEKDEY